ncbi:MAG: hypothetical protein C4534_04600 [Gaiellales bacterium]|nr:MAG: hypothetical protein C4534_04600 [Gaiellales bacterium]
MGGVYAPNKESNASIGMQRMQELGVDWHREWVPWHQWQASRGGSLDSSTTQMLDAIERFATQRGISVYGVIYGAPSWANGSSDPVFIPGNGDPQSPAFRQFVTDYGDFVYRVVSQYKGRIDHWEIWMEPDLNGFWRTSSPTTVYEKAAGYSLLLKTAYTRAKEANPDSVIIMGGVTAWYSDEFIAEMYRQGAGPYFDKANIHPWTENPSGKPSTSRLFAKIGNLRRTMDANGDVAKGIWISAIGWSTTGNVLNRSVSEAQQMEYMIDALETARNEYPSVEVMTIFRLMDRNWYDSDDMEAGFGLLYTSAYRDGILTGKQMFEPKPYFYMLKDYLRASQDDLYLSVDSIHWQSYEDYQSRRLTTVFNVRNRGLVVSNNVSIVQVSQTNHVVHELSLPMDLGTINPGEVRQFPVKFLVPPGVSNFRVSVSGEAIEQGGRLVYFPSG